jgi:hypothetical protein
LSTKADSRVSRPSGWLTVMSSMVTVAVLPGPIRWVLVMSRSARYEMYSDWSRKMLAGSPPKSLSPKRASSRKAGGPAKGTTARAPMAWMYRVARDSWLARFSRPSCAIVAGS